MAVERIAKIAVAIMTVLIIVLASAVLWGIANPPSAPKNAAQNAEVAKRTLPDPAWAASLPPGKIRAISSAGNYLAVLLDTPDAAEIYVFDPRDSRLVGSLREGDIAP